MQSLLYYIEKGPIAKDAQASLSHPPPGDIWLGPLLEGSGTYIDQWGLMEFYCSSVYKVQQSGSNVEFPKQQQAGRGFSNIQRQAMKSGGAKQSHHMFTTKLFCEHQNALVLIASDFCWELLLSQIYTILGETKDKDLKCIVHWYLTNWQIHFPPGNSSDKVILFCLVLVVRDKFLLARYEHEMQHASDKHFKCLVLLFNKNKIENIIYCLFPICHYFLSSYKMISS